MDNPSIDTGRPRSKSTFSFRSQKSDSTSKPKIDLTETEADKKRSRFSGKSKVNPNRALNEPQPVFDALERPTLPELRTQQFRDVYGNLIADPDRTNPGRHRLERPLDTIRGFEAAIDSGHKKRSHAIRAESAEPMSGFQSRRQSYAMNDREIPHFERKYSPASVYSTSRHTSFRGNYDYSGHNQFPQRRSVAYNRMPPSPMPARTISEPYGVYNSRAYHESHDTVNTAAESNGSQSTEPLGYSTDPSSENSSIDRVHAARQMDSGDAYGGAQYSRGSPMRSPIHEEYWQDGRYHAQETYERRPIQQQALPRPPMGPPPTSYVQPAAPRPIIQLGNGYNTVTQAQGGYTASSTAKAQQSPEKAEKRGSWLKRRFSKNNN